MVENLQDQFFSTVVGLGTNLHGHEHSKKTDSFIKVVHVYVNLLAHVRLAHLQNEGQQNPYQNNNYFFITSQTSLLSPSLFSAFLTAFYTGNSDMACYSHL